MFLVLGAGLGLCLGQQPAATAPATTGPSAGSKPAASGPTSSSAPAATSPAAAGKSKPGARGADGNSSGKGKPLPLVTTNDELAAYLNQARECIDGNEPLRAIEILQRVIDLPDAALIGDSEGRRYVSIAYRASDLIGSMNADGLALYRSIYDPQAQRLYEDALAAGDAGLLRKLVYRFVHTTYGPRAMNMLGAMAFDVGRFAQAARYWRQVALLHSPEVSDPLLLAKVAAAQHLAGEESRSRETVALLKEKYPSASALVGGQERSLQEFLQDISKVPVVIQASAGPRGEGWAGLGSQGDGMGVMTEVDVVLSPRWYDPPQGSRGTVRLTASADLGRVTNPQMRMNYVLKEGHIEGLAVNNPNYGYDPGMSRKMVLPPIIHPVVVGDVVIYRSDSNVTAVDLVTGESRWHSVELPMERTPKTPNNNGYYNPYGMQIEDTGRYTLTVADGKVFAVANFKKPGNPNEDFMNARTGGVKEADSSELVAISVVRQGSQVWRVGNQKGPTAGDPNFDVLNLGRFLCAPTYEAGRLYVVCVYQESYYLMCLSADTGQMFWKQMICQVPVVTSDFNPYMTVVHKAFPPAVCDGRVYVATNGGVVASMDAETGQSVWAFQYDSPYNQVAAARGMGMYRPPTPGKSYPPNPILVTGGKVVFLPADSERLVALSAEDGAVVWDVDRGNMRDLSAIDAGRVCLSGPGMAVISLADGAKLAEVPLSENIMGRPAVTPVAVYASGRGKLIRLDLADYKSSSRPLAGIEDNLGLLGNLVAVREELVAANAMGICSYMNYDQAMARLARRMESADAKGRCDLLLTRGRFSYSAKHYPEALADLTAAREQAAQLGLGDVQARARPWLHRACVAMGNISEDSNVSLEMYEKALTVAETAQEKGHMRVRLAKFHRALGAADDAQASLRQKAGDSAGAAQWNRKKVEELSKAVALAQELSEQQGDEELVDVAVGKDADDSILLDGRADYILGRRLARDLIQGVIRAYGREPYAAMDALAKAALDDARQKGDEQALARVGLRWPESVWADSSILLAAEGAYRKSGQDNAEAAKMSAQVRKWLAPLVTEAGDTTTRISACIGMAAVYSRGGWTGAARTNMQKARELAAEVSGGAGGDLEVSFADLRGKLDAVLKQIDDGKFARSLRPQQDVSSIKMPLVPALTFKDEGWSILRDQDSRPIRIGEKVLMLQGNRAVLVSTVANDPNQAVDWQALTSVDQAILRQNSSLPPAMKLVAGLSRDEKVVAVCDRSSIRGFSVETAKALWSNTMDRLDMSGGPVAMAIGDGYAVLVNTNGDVSCVDLGTGKLLWKGIPLSGQPNNPQAKYPCAPPQIVGGKILIRHNYGQAMTLLDANDNGRVLGKWQSANSHMTGEFAPNGNLAILVDGVLSLFDAGQLHGTPLWTKKYVVGEQPMLLAVSNDYVAVLPGMNRTAPVVEVLSAAGGELLASVNLPDVGNQRSNPVAAAIEGTNLLVTASSNYVGPRNNLQQAQPVMGITLHRIDLEKKRRIWSYEVEPAGQPFNSLLTSPVIGTNYVAMLARSQQGGEASVHVIDMETGKTAGKIDVMGKGQAFGQPQMLRLQMIGPPVMTNGRLCVETLEGVVIYGGQ